MPNSWRISWQVLPEGEHDVLFSWPSATAWLVAIVKVTLWNWQEVNDEI